MITKVITRAVKNLVATAVLTIGVQAQAQVDLPLAEVQEILTSDLALTTITETILIPDEVLEVATAYYRDLFENDLVAAHIRQSVPPDTLADLLDPDINRHFPAAYTIADMFPMLSDQAVQYLALADLRVMLEGIVHAMEVMPADQCEMAANRQVPPEQGVEWARAALMTQTPEALARYLDAKSRSILLAIDPSDDGRTLSVAEMQTAQDRMLAEMNAFLTGDGAGYASLPLCQQFVMVATHMLSLEEETQDLVLRLLVGAAAPE